jgi:mediator of RNA polymerase II transcription subunit 17, fungi type
MAAPEGEAMATAATPFDLRPWPRGDKKPKNLAEFITRINFERSGFRNVTEASLREEIAAEKEAPSQEDIDEDDKDGEDEAEKKDIRVVRDQMLRDARYVLTAKEGS